MQGIIESLRKQRQQLIEDLGDDIFSRHTSLLEIAIMSLYNRLVNRLSKGSEEFRASGAVVALGAFGSGTMGPDDSVQILLLQADTAGEEIPWQHEIAAPLEEAGWKLEVSLDDIDRIAGRAEIDFPYLQQLLAARYVSGSRPLMALRARFAPVPYCYRLKSDGEVDVSTPVYVNSPSNIATDHKILDYDDYRLVLPFDPTGQPNPREIQRQKETCGLSQAVRRRPGSIPGAFRRREGGSGF